MKLFISHSRRKAVIVPTDQPVYRNRQEPFLYQERLKSDVDYFIQKTLLFSALMTSSSPGVNRLTVLAWRKF